MTTAVRIVDADDRHEYADGRLDAMAEDAFETPVALLAKLTGEPIATYRSLEAAFAAMPDLSDGVRASGFLAWATAEPQ